MHVCAVRSGNYINTKFIFHRVLLKKRPFFFNCAGSRRPLPAMFPARDPSLFDSAKLAVRSSSAPLPSSPPPASAILRCTCLWIQVDVMPGSRLLYYNISHHISQSPPQLWACHVLSTAVAEPRGAVARGHVARRRHDAVTQLAR